MFGFRFWGLSALYTLGAALLIGLPTVLIPNRFFIRMTPTSPQDYVIWVISVALIGPVMALATLYPTGSTKSASSLAGKGSGRALTGTLLSIFSVGCPICNKLVVLFLGLAGAMTFFNPLRPLLGIASIVLLAGTLFLRVRVLRHGCPVSFNDHAAKIK
jgi:predicted membrane protein